MRRWPAQRALTRRHALIGAALFATTPARARNAVRLGATNSLSDVVTYIAEDKGMFRDEGLDVESIGFDSAGKMVAPLASGELDAGSGGVNAGLFNAAARGLGIKIVADKNSSVPGFGNQPLLVRRDLVDSGRFRTLADLKGMKISTASPGTSASTNLDRVLSRAGLSLSDVQQVYMGFPQQAAALANKAIDAAFTTEPSASQVIAAGAATRVIGDDEIFPNHQLAVILYSGVLIRERPAVAEAFMRAYIRAARFFTEGLVGNRLRGPRGAEILEILARRIPLTGNLSYADLPAPACNPDGRINLESLGEDLAFFRRQGFIEGETSVAAVTDTRFVDAAVKALGPWRR